MDQPTICRIFTAYRHINLLSRQEPLLFETKALDLVKVCTRLMENGEKLEH
jgi:hypothetical protein